MSSESLKPEIQVWLTSGFMPKTRRSVNKNVALHNELFVQCGTGLFWTNSPVRGTSLHPGEAPAANESPIVYFKERTTKGW
jgi:hypothetical protein